MAENQNQESQNPDVALVYEYGIKLDGHMSEFIPLGIMALPLESLEDLGTPELTEGFQQADEEMIMNSLVIVIRPLPGDEDEDNYSR
jgi:hypothetical protein